MSHQFPGQIQPDAIVATVDDQAADWVACLMSPECTPQDRAAFEDWLAQSPEHIPAYLEAERVHALTAALASDDLIRAAARAARREAPTRRIGKVLGPALAAALVAAVGVVVFWPRETPVAEQTYATQMGQQRQVTLADGTAVTLDADTRLVTRFDADHRRVELQQGRAQFVVGKDPRPFAVHAGAGIVRDIGTTFQVSRLGKAVHVALLDGQVEVSTDVNGTAHRSLLVPGEGITVDDAGSIGSPTPLDIAQVQSWPKGDLVFRQQRLDDLLAQMNRYSPQQVSLADPQLGALAVSGVFHVGDQASLVAALERGWSLRAVRASENEIVLHGPNSTQ